MKNKTIIILSVSSDIGNFLSQQYLTRGWKVIGTYRQKKNLKGLEDQNCDLYQVDVTKPQEIKSFIIKLKQKKISWDRLICSVGTLTPAQDFFDGNFDQWHDSVMVNAIGPLRIVHGLYPLAVKKAQIVFFAGGAANGAVKHMSAYAISKIMLTKMTEFIDAEYPHLHVSIIGPGWTLTKIHQDILNDKNAAKSKLLQTKHDIKYKSSTSLTDIDACIEWVCRQPKTLTSGRNFSVVYDPWRINKGQSLIAALKKDANMYKLRRHRNEFLQ